MPYKRILLLVTFLIIYSGAVLAKELATPAVLQASPREIDLGVVGPGQVAQGIFTLKNSGPESMTWSTRGPEGWSHPEQQELSTTLNGGVVELKLNLRILADDDPKSLSYPVKIGLEAGTLNMTCVKNLQPGSHREAIRLVSPSGTQTVFFRFKIIRPESEPLLVIEPLRIDLGRVGVDQHVSKVIRVMNRGRNTLKWLVNLRKGENDETNVPVMGRYISFLNEEVRGNGTYTAAGHLKESVELSGRWSENSGYPRAEANSAVMKLRFSGTGVSVLVWKGPGGGNLVAFVDDTFAGTENCRSEHDEETEFLVADDLPNGGHTLTIMAKEGSLLMEGVRIYGVPVLTGNPGWVNFSPDGGITMRETDYVNIVVNTQKMKPGFYGEKALFCSNGGEEIVEISLEVAAENTAKVLDVYRYTRGSDYLYTTTPQTEAKRLNAGGYVKQGIAFRLFTPGTPGTTEFYRWYNSAEGDHYYSYDPHSGRSMRGYTYEGSIGNIATSKLTGTRELYRWFNQRTGSHFYSTNASAEGRAKRGYRFEGIAGYVR